MSQITCTSLSFQDQEFDHKKAEGERLGFFYWVTFHIPRLSIFTRTMSESSSSNNPLRLLILYALVEGVGVSAFEFIGAKTVSGFYGSTLQMWTVVLGITMFSLSLGYYLGGRISRKSNAKSWLPVLALGAVAFLAINQLAAIDIMLATFELGVIQGGLISAIVLLLPGLLCIGALNPIVIGLTDPENQQAGKASGQIFAIATLGGIVSALILGLVLLPEWGKKGASLVVIAFMLLGIALVIRQTRYVRSWGGVITLIGAVCFSLLLTVSIFNATPGYRQHVVYYESDGLLGDVLVIDHLHGTPNRMLYVNAISQTNVDLNTGVSNGLYVHRIAAASSFKPAGSNVLIIGIGGGSLVKEFQQLGFNIDVCDLDQRMIDVTRDYFNTDLTGVGIAIDDARHYIKTCDKQYDIVVFDIAWGEVQPSHVFTIEGFEDLKEILSNDQSFVFIHYTDASDDEIASRSIFNTINQAGYKVKTFVPHPNIPDDKVHLALLAEPDPNQFIPNRFNPCCLQGGNIDKLIELGMLSIEDTYTLTDDLPLLDILNSETTQYYRKLSIENLIVKRYESDAF